MFSILYTIYIRQNGGDSLNYWFSAYGYRFFTFEDVVDTLVEHPSTGTLLLLNYSLSKYLGISYWVGNLIYSGVAVMGLNYFLLLVEGISKDRV